MFRITIVAAAFFAIGFYSRPWLVELAARYILNPPEPPIAQTFLYEGALSGENLNQILEQPRDAPPGEGADQLFDACDPVSIELTVSPTLDPMPPEQFFVALGDGGFVTVDDTAVDFTLTIGDPDGVSAIARLGDMTEMSALGDALYLQSGNNTIVANAVDGDAFGYIELFNGFVFSASTASIRDVASYADLVTFFAAVDEISGQPDFRFCDASLLDEDFDCPPMVDPGLPFSAKLRFAPSCAPA